MARITNEQVVEAFMNQRAAKAGALQSDGQSLFSFQLRIAEHIPKNCGACTVVYDYTAGGNAFKSQPIASHVSLVKRRVPRRNWMRVAVAKDAGLIP